MKKIYLLLFAAVLFIGSAMGQANTANYSFTTSVTGSLTDMSSGTTVLLAGNLDDNASSVTNIGFDFFFQGAHFSQFSVNSNGSLQLGSATISNTFYEPLAGAGLYVITAYGADQRTHITDGKVHFKVIGSAPNRTLVVEWLNMQSDFNTGGTADGTYQVRLSETTGVIEFAYGSMKLSVAGAADANSNTPQIGFSSGNTAGNVGTVTAAQSGLPAPTYNGAATVAAVNTYTAGSSTVLTSAANGSRRIFTFTPPSPSGDPSGLNFTAVSPSSMTLNWADNTSNETAFAIFMSTDGINYTFSNQVAANSLLATESGLTPSTTYYWKVYAVTEGAVSNPTTGSQSTSAPGNISSNGTGGGLWSATTTWSGGVVPGAGDNVTILATDQVTEDVTAATAYTLTVAGTLEYEATLARTLTVGSDVTINSGGTIRTPLVGSTVTTHVLSVAGNLTNNGTLNLSTNTNLAGARITFTGVANTTFGGTGATTNIFTMTINKGTSSASTVELNTPNFLVQGVSTNVAGFLTLTNGTLKISGSFTLANRMFTAAAYTIPATGGFWLNNPNVTVSGQAGSPTNNGMLRLTQGIYNVGTATGNSIGAGAGASYTIEGGAMNVTGRLLSNNAITYTQSAGTVTVGTIGNASSGAGAFQLGSAGATFNMSGGTIIVVQRNTTATAANRLDFVNVGLVNITGGTLQIGSAATATNFDFHIYGYTPSIVVNNTTNAKSVGLGTTYNLGVIYGSLTLNTGTSFIGTTAAAAGELDVVGGDININSGATFTTNGSFIFMAGTNIVNNGTFNGTGIGTVLYWSGTTTPQTYSGSGVVTAGLVEMSLDNAAGLTFSSPVNALSFDLFTGSVTGTNLITIGNGAATTGRIQIGNTTTPSLAGTFDAAPIFNAGTGGMTLQYLRTGAARNTGFEVPASRTVTTLAVDENDVTHPLTISGGDLTAIGTFTYTNGNIITGSNTLISGTSVAAPGTFTYTNNGIIIGNFRRWITATGTNWNFPVGISSAKRNASIDFTANPPTTGGTLTASWVSSPEGINGLPLGPNAQTNGEILSQTSAEGYWSVVAADGLAGGTYTGTFSGTGLTVADYTRLVLIKRPNNASAWVLDGNYIAPAPGNIVAASNMSGFSEFGLAADAGLVATNLNYFRGSKQGNANYLNWKLNVTGDAVAVSLQRSTDGSNFASINNTSATATSSLNPFDYTDASPVAGRDYYRLKMTELSGKVTYSSIVVLLSGTKGTEIVSIAPTVTSGTFNLNVSSVKAGTMIVMITDMSGQIVSKQMVTMIGGFNSINMDVSKLAAGTYRIFGINEDGRTNAAGFIKK